MAPDPLPSPQPTYVLRGHAAQIHALHFLRGNSRLLTGDADGWVVCWDMAYKRPMTVWRAHQNAILGLASWEESRAVLTHGRDNQLVVWQLGLTNGTALDKTLPNEDATSTRAQPWILHILTVNALNFCSFSMCHEVPKSKRASPSILLAMPSTDDSEGVDVFQLPTERRTSTIAAEKRVKTGMVMALSICETAISLLVAAGYESGHTMLYSQSPSAKEWSTLYSCQPHSQPILSLSSFINNLNAYYLTSSADAVIAKHLFLRTSTSGDVFSDSPLKTINTKHSGQQGLVVRSDGKIFATAGWDARIRVYSCKTMKEVAVLKWHREGCTAVAFAGIAVSTNGDEEGLSHQAPSDHRLEMVEGSSSSFETLQNRQQLEIQDEQQHLTEITYRDRQKKAQLTHWLAAGSKDGKVSLWDIY